MSNREQYVFSQLMDHLPLTTFRRCVARYQGEHKIHNFSCLDQFRCFAFAQLTWRESLRDTEACLRAQSSKLYHLGFHSATISRNTMSNANSTRDWRIYADFAQRLTTTARELYVDDVPEGLDELGTVYALDSSTIALCLSVFPGAPFRSTKAAINPCLRFELMGQFIVPPGSACYSYNAANWLSFWIFHNCTHEYKTSLFKYNALNINSFYSY